MKKTKRIISVLLCTVLLLSCAFCFAACNDNGGNGEPGGVSGGSDNKFTYSVKVVAGENGVPGAKVQFVCANAGNKLVTTDDEGIAKIVLDAEDTVSAKITSVPKSYTWTAEDKAKLYTVEEGEVKSVKIADAVKTVTYTIYVKDASGAAVSGVQVQICADLCLMPKTSDAEGKVVYEMTDDGKTYKAQITAEGATYFEFDENNTVTITVGADKLPLANQ